MVMVLLHQGGMAGIAREGWQVGEWREAGTTWPYLAPSPATHPVTPFVEPTPTRGFKALLAKAEARDA